MPDPPGKTGVRRRIVIYRHPIAVRATHWVNVLCMAVLLASGLQIFNAHPALYLGRASTFSRPALAITSDQTADGSGHGRVQVLGGAIETTGVLGVSAGD